MALALSTLSLFLFFLPGIAFKRAYLSSVFSRKAKFSGLVDEVFWAVFPSIIMHFVAFGILSLAAALLNFQFNITQLFTVLIGNTSDQPSVVSFLYYCVSVIGVAYVAGHVSRRVVRILKLDRRFRLFRFSNDWHYLLSGEFLDFPEVPDHPEEVSFKLVNVLTQTGGDTMIYIGELIHFTLSDEGGLDTIVLKDAKRRFLKDDLVENRYYDIPGRYITIPYKTILNINIRYFYIEELTGVADGEELL
ncbi:MAG: hypothetical protein QM762_28235 [Chryseolinea sp.]